MFKLRLWEKADNYIGEDLSDYYVGLSRSRDSDTLEESNFHTMLDALGGEDRRGSVMVGRFSNWAVGWHETIFVRKTAKTKVKKLQAIFDDLNAYPVLDESDLSERDSEEANDDWNNFGRDQATDLLGVDLSGKYNDLLHSAFHCTKSYHGETGFYDYECLDWCLSQGNEYPDDLKQLISKKLNGGV